MAFKIQHLRLSSVSSIALFCLQPLLGCSADNKQQAATPQAVGLSDAELFMPLLDDTVYSYKTYSESTGDSGILVMEVHRTRGDLAELHIAGRIQLLYLDQHGIRHAGGGHLLKVPLSLGETWKGQFGEVKVTRLDRTIQTPAGSFSRCIETVEQIPEKRATTVFCPRVGMVFLEVEGESRGEFALETAELSYHGPKVDVTKRP